MDTIARDHQVQLVRAFAAHLEANPDADVHTGLCAMVGHVQGDDLDPSERDLLATQTGALIGK